MSSFFDLSGPIPFSRFYNSKTLKRSLKSKNNKKTKKKSNKDLNEILNGKCKCKKNFSKNDKSPNKYGYCAKCLNENIMMRGVDGNLWKTKKNKKTLKWVRV